MCEIFDKIRNKGKEEGREEGREEGISIGIDKGKIDTTVKHIKRIMMKMNYTIEEAMDLLNVPETEQQLCKYKIYS